MIPKDQFDQDYQYILKKIKEKTQNLQSDNTIALYITPKQTDSLAPSDVIQVKIIEELNKQNIIKIVNRITYKNDNTGTFQKYEFKILPKYYEEYNKLGSVQKQDSEPKAIDSNLQLTLKPKCLEMIAKEIGHLDSEINLQKFLIGCGVDKELIEDRPNKWRMVYDVMLRLSTSDNKPKDALTLFQIICQAVHPFLDKRDEARAEKLLRRFNSILKFDSASIYFDEQEKVYKIKFEVDMLPNAEQEKVNEETSKHYESLSKKDLLFLCRPENKEKISLLRKMYILLMDVVSIFCENPSEPTTELNSAYQYLDGQVWGIINSLKLKCSSIDNFSRYPSPFVNLFSAEKFFQEQGKELCWQKIRPGMHAMYGEIENLHQVVNGSDILSEPDEQEKLNEIELTLSECKEELEEHKKQDALPKPILPIPLEVTINTPQTSKITNVVMPKVKLSAVTIKYDDNAAILHFGDQKCQLPPFKNEHYLCRTLFEHNKDEAIDWEIVYEKITGYYEKYYGKPSNIRNNWRIVYDTMQALNQRIKDTVNTDDDFLSWQEKTIKRNY